MDRKDLKRWFTKDRTPDWICPSCGKGVLHIKPETFHSNELARSRDHNHDAWEPEWIESVYTCLLYCSNNNCKEVVVSSGIGSVDWSVEEDIHGIPEQVYEDYYRPKYFNPTLKIIEIPQACSKEVADPIMESFSLVFSSPSSAANCIRVAVEQLLTDLKVKRFNVAGGKRRFISLHQRIGLVPQKYEEIKDLILAIKWLGNTGSHSRSDMSFDDVMDAYEFLDHILAEVYVQKVKRLKAKAKVVNKKKGPKR